MAQPTQRGHSYGYESDISAIAYLHDTTSYIAIASTGLATAGAANTATTIIDLTRYSENTFYINSTGGPAANAGTTGLTVFFDARPASAIGWVNFRTESAVDVSSVTALRIIGSGVAATSGIKHWGDVRITIENTTDSSGTATVVGYIKSRTPE